MSNRLIQQNSPAEPQGSGSQLPHSQGTWVRLTGVLGLLLLAPTATGCTVWLHRHQETITWQQETVLDEHPVGLPEAVVTPHADGLGWTLTVHEQVEQTIARRGTKSWIGVPAHVAPGLSWGVAAVGCMSVPWAMLIILMGGPKPSPSSMSHYSSYSSMKPIETVTDACLYPLMGFILPSSGGYQVGSEAVTEKRRREWAWRPAGQAEVGIRFPGREWWRFPVEPDGRKSLRLDRLPFDRDLPLDGHVELALWARGKPVKQWTEQIEPSAWLQVQQHPTIAPVHWPARLAVGLLPWEGLTEREQPRWERRLVQELSRVTTARGGTLLLLNSDIHTLLDIERRRQYSGPVADDKQVRIGHEEGATILIRPIARTSRSLLIVGADVLAVETGETLTSITWEVPPTALDGAAEALIARLGHLLEQAPAPVHRRVRTNDPLR